MDNHSIDTPEFLTVFSRAMRELGYPDASELYDLRDRLHMIESHSFTQEWITNFGTWSGHIHETLLQHVESMVNQMALSPLALVRMENRLGTLEIRFYRLMNSGRVIPPFPPMRAPFEMPFFVIRFALIMTFNKDSILLFFLPSNLASQLTARV